MMKNIMRILIIVIFIDVFFNTVFGTNMIIEETSNTLNLTEMIESLDKYTNESKLGSELDLKDISKNLMFGKNNDYSKIIQKIIDIFAGETISVLKNSITVLIVIVIMGIFNCLEMEKNGSIGKIAYLISSIIIVTILSNMYIEILKDYTKTIKIITSIMQTVTPFITIVMIAAGGIVSSNLIEPVILFIASLVGFLVNYIVIPFVTIAIVMNIVSSFSTNIRLNKLGELFSKSGLWITSVVFTLFLSFISVKGSITTSIDATVVKTTQTAVSNFVPVVGKFVSDSLESIIGATEVIGKTAGILGIIVMIVVSAVPIIQMIIIFVSHKVLAALAEAIIDNKNTISIIDSFAETYKVLLGVLVGILALYLMSSGVLIKLIGSIT